MSDEQSAPTPSEVPERLAYTSPPALMTAVVLSIVLVPLLITGFVALGRRLDAGARAA